MSHHLVMNASRINIDFEHAQSLMDHRLAQRSLQWVADHAGSLAKSGVASQEQAIFDDYCRRHLECFGEPFAADIALDPY